jgi:L-fuconolactonase
MEIVDLQLHDPAPFLPWDNEDENTRRDVVKEVLFQMMDAIGVEAVVLHPVDDLELGFQLAQEFPGRFSSTPMLTGGDPEGLGKIAINPHVEGVEDRIAEMSAKPGVVGLRFVPSPNFFPEEFENYRTGGYDHAFAACQELGLPVLLMVSGHAATVARVAEKFPDLQIILDHIGIPQSPMEMPEDDRWGPLAQVLPLGRYENVAVKLCHPIGLSLESYPFKDVWPYMHKLLDAFGAERLAWGSDVGRFRGRVAWSIRVPGTEEHYPGKHNYMESLAFFLYTDELSEAEKESILGGSTRRLLRWPAPTEVHALG